MSAPQLIHLVGPQGSGKTILAGLLAEGLRAQGRAVDVIDGDDALDLSNQDIRRKRSGYGAVIVIAHCRDERHIALPAGDLVITLERGQ